MARIRTIKPEFFTSPDTASVSHTARLLYVAMWCLADDYGRGEMNMLQLRAFAFPEEDHWLDSELQRKSKEFQSLCKEVVNGFGIDVYRHRGRTFYSIPSWDEHQKTQRRAKSRFPAPDDAESVPDQRFSCSGGTSESLQGSSEQTQGNVPLGTGKRNIGTGEQGIKDMSETSSDVSTPKPNAYPDEFEQWWRAYPRHKNASKKKSLNSWRKALKIVEADRLLELTRTYAANPGVDEVRLIPHPTTWLNEHRWESVEEADNQPPQQRRKGGWDFGRYDGTSPPIIDAEVYPMREIAQ